MLEYGILGPLAVTVERRPLDLAGPRQRCFLGVLLLNRNTVVSIDRMIDLVWGEDPPASAEAALQNQVSKLRRLLGADLIETGPPGYRLHADPGSVDANGSRHWSPRGGRPRRLRQATSFAKDSPSGAGRPSDLAHEPFAEVEIARLEKLRLGATEARIDADLGSGLHEPLIAELEALVTEHPYREIDVLLGDSRCERSEDPVLTNRRSVASRRTAVSGR